MKPKETKTARRFEAYGIVLVAEKDLSYTVEEDKDEIGGKLFILWCEEFLLYGAGSTEGMALRELNKGLVDVWSAYTKGPDGQFDLGGRLLRNRLLERFKEEGKTDGKK